MNLTEKDVARFWAKVDRSGECWLWTAGKSHDGYGRFNYGGRSGFEPYAHRVAYFLECGDLPDGPLDHVCHVRACVRPVHLRPVTTKQNNENRTGAQPGSVTGVRGVYRTRSGYGVSVKHYGIKHYGGHFARLDDAAEAARLLRNQLFTHNDKDRTV